jgi:hypothetical protein
MALFFASGCALRMTTLMPSLPQLHGNAIEIRTQGRAAHATRLVARLTTDLTKRFGRGFGAVNLAQMRKLYQTWSTPEIFQTPAEKSSRQNSSRLLPKFPLSRSHRPSPISLRRPMYCPDHLLFGRVAPYHCFLSVRHGISEAGSSVNQRRGEDDRTSYLSRRGFLIGCPTFFTADCMLPTSAIAGIAHEPLI